MRSYIAARHGRRDRWIIACLFSGRVPTTLLYYMRTRMRQSKQLQLRSQGPGRKLKFLNERAHASSISVVASMVHGPGAAACPVPARPGHGNIPARARAARRLGRLASTLHWHGRTRPVPWPKDVRSQAASRTVTTPWTAAPWGAGPDDRLCLAARVLSQMLCDEPSAARCRSTVRCEPCGLAWLKVKSRH